MSDCTSPSRHSSLNSCASDETDGQRSRTKTVMRNTSRDRMMTEKAALCTEVLELESDLSRLLAERTVARYTAPSPVWRSLARRQLKRRVLAQDENKRLRARLRRQLQTAKMLETVIRNRVGAGWESEALHHSPQRQYPVNDLAALHERCMDEIDECYMQVDAVFDAQGRRQDVGYQPLRCRRTFTQPESSHCGHYAEMHTTSYAPFPFEKVCSATWRAITMEYARQNRLIELYRSTDDESTSKFWLPQVTEEHQLSATVSIRKFHEEERLVLVGLALSIKESDHESCVYGSETGWLVAERVADAVTGEPSDDGTVIRIYARYKPNLTEATESNKARSTVPAETCHETPRDFTSQLLEGIEADIASMTDAIENMLLDDAFGPSHEALEDVEGLHGLLPVQSLSG